MKQKDKIDAYERILHALHLARVIGNSARITELLDLISAWDFAHRCGNGEQSDNECNKNIESFVKRMQEV